MSEPLSKDDELVKQYDDSDKFGRWIGKTVYKDSEGNEYTMCCNQHGDEWIED